MTQRKPFDPSTTLFIAPGGKYAGHIDTDGVGHAETPFVRRVGISDITQVAEHRINHAYGSVSHYVRFTDGAYLHFIADNQGNITELFMRGLDAVMTAEGDISVWSRQQAR